MKSVFADSLYWIAMARPNDQHKLAATAARRAVGDVVLVTTDEVLTEFLAALSKSGPQLRDAATKMVRAVLRNPNVKVIPQTRDGFLKGLDRFEQRLDKQYSLIDCVSMVVMESEGIQSVLTNDHHFEQEGFTILIRE
jgi:predicted nucleic acid-binding protein